MTKIIAELCQNHNGDTGLIKELVSAAKESGASYAKMQTIHSNQLTYRERFDNGISEGSRIRCIKRPFKAELDRLSSLDISDKSVEVFLQSCEEYKIEPMTTIFTRDVIKKTFKQGFKNIKLYKGDVRLTTKKYAKENLQIDNNNIGQDKVVKVIKKFI